MCRGRVDLADLLDPRFIESDLKAKDKEGVLRELLNLLVAGGKVQDPEESLKGLLKREEIGTAIGRGTAFPHAAVSGVNEASMAIGISRGGLDFQALDHKPVYLFFMFLFPKGNTARTRLIGQIMSLMRKDEVRNSLLEATTPQDVKERLKKFL